MPWARTPGPLRRAPPHGTGNTMRAHGLPPTGKRSADGEGGGQQEQDWQQRSAGGGRQPPWQSTIPAVFLKVLVAKSVLNSKLSKNQFSTKCTNPQNAVQKLWIRVNGGTILRYHINVADEGMRVDSREGSRVIVLEHFMGF